MVTLCGFACARLGHKSEPFMLTMLVIDRWMDNIHCELNHIRPYFESFTVLTNFVLTPTL